MGDPLPPPLQRPGGLACLGVGHSSLSRRFLHETQARAASWQLVGKAGEVGNLSLPCLHRVIIPSATRDAAQDRGVR